jgi:hypothetical protein
MERKKINYKDVIDRGFKRIPESDKIFFNENGYDWFIVEKKLTKGFSLDWDCKTHFITLIRANKESEIKGRIFLTGDLEELDRVIKFFTGDVPDREEDIESEGCHNFAC